MVEGSCTFCIGTEKEITKFKWYGNPEGTFEMDDQKITLYKKSKVVKQAFGLIGSAMSGKGKYEAEITKEQIVGYKHDKKGSFWIDLNDSNKFYFCITGLGKKDKYDLVEKFLSEAVKMPGKTVTNTNTVNGAPKNPAPANTGVNTVPPTQQAYTQQPAYQNVSASQPQSNQASSKLKFSASYRTIPAHTENNGGNMAMNQTTGTTSESFENIAQQLKMYKELLDSGLITEDDFNAKKKQLLNL